MQNVAGIAEALEAEIHAPAFGSGLSMGCWPFVETLIEEIWCDWNIPVTIYSLEEIPRRSIKGIKLVDVPIALAPIIPPIGPVPEYVKEAKGKIDPNADLLGI